MEPVWTYSQRCSEPLARASRKAPPNDLPAGSERKARLLAITLGRCAARDPFDSRSWDSRRSRGEGSTCDICVSSHCAFLLLGARWLGPAWCCNHLVGPLCCESVLSRGQAGLWRAL